jgi:hypothetical protein
MGYAFQLSNFMATAFHKDTFPQSKERRKVPPLGGPRLVNQSPRYPLAHLKEATSPSDFKLMILGKQSRDYCSDFCVLQSCPVHCRTAITISYCTIKHQTWPDLRLNSCMHLTDGSRLPRKCLSHLPERAGCRLCSVSPIARPASRVS